MIRLFTEHPASVGETYAQHAVFALRYGWKMTRGGLAALVHGLLPFLFTTTASRLTDELAQTLERQRGGRRQVPPAGRRP
jgi:hypothetical protein